MTAVATVSKPKRAKKPKKDVTDWKKIGAPLVEVDPLELTDKRLHPLEANQAKREEILKIESVKRIHGQDELEKSERSLGPRLYYTEILRRVKKCSPGLVVKDGSEGSVALYYPIPVELRELDPNTPPNGRFFIDHEYVGGMLKDWLPEWGHVTIDTSLIADKEVRGWRSVLIQLIKKDVLKYQDAISEFGDPFFDQRSQFWYEQLVKVLN